MDRPIMLMMPAEGASITSIIGIIVHHFCLQDMLQGCFRVARIHGFSTRNGVPIALLTLGVRMRPLREYHQNNLGQILDSVRDRKTLQPYKA